MSRAESLWWGILEDKAGDVDLGYIMGNHECENCQATGA